jgi:hypothetical protein
MCPVTDAALHFPSLSFPNHHLPSNDRSAPSIHNHERYFREMGDPAPESASASMFQTLEQYEVKMCILGYLMRYMRIPELVKHVTKYSNIICSANLQIATGPASQQVRVQLRRWVLYLPIFASPIEID